MFGLLTETPDAEWSTGRLGRFRGRRFGDIDWGALATASANLTAGVVNAVAQATRGQTQTNVGTSYSCPQGYVFDQTMGTCRALPTQGSAGSFLDNIPPTTLAVGGLVLVLLLTQRS